MKKIIFLCTFLYMGQCFSDASMSEFSCDPKKYLPENLLEKVLIHRESAFNICLNCNGDECAFRDQLLNDEKSLNLCKRLFCSASFASRGFEIPADAPRGLSSFKYSYSISKKGHVEKINIIESSGAFSPKDALKFLKALTRKTRYEPINYQGNTYKLIGLSSEMSINTKLVNE